MIQRTLQGALLAAAIMLPGSVLAKEATTPPAGQPAQRGMVFTNDTIDKVNAQPGSIQATRDVATGQASGIQSPRDPATGLATGVVEQSGTATTQPGQANNALVNNENVQGQRGTATAQTGQFIGGGSDGQGIRRKPPGQRPRKGRRMHKP